MGKLGKQAQVTIYKLTIPDRFNAKTPEQTAEDRFEAHANHTALD